MTNWDDAQYVLALSRMGTIRAAAKSLAVNHTTVSRRIATLEKQLSARLFELTPSGYVMTVSGEIVCKAAEQMEVLLLSSHRRIEGADAELSGEVHIHLPDAFEDAVCMRLSPFLQQHTKICIQFSTDLAVANLAKREADIAVRFTSSPPLDMVGQVVSRAPVAVYASVDFEIDSFSSVSEINSTKKPLSQYPWLRWAPEFRDTDIERWSEKAAGNATVAARVSTNKTMINLMQNGVGIGCLSPWIAKDYPKLKQVTPIIDEAGMDVWVLIHPDLRGVKRIKAVKDLLVGIFVGENKLF